MTIYICLVLYAPPIPKEGLSTGAMRRCGDIVLSCRWTLRGVSIPSPGSRRRHIMHVVLGTLAEKGFEDKYSEIRKAYNSVMSRSWTPKAPPFEEWSGITEICNNAFCR